MRSESRLHRFMNGKGFYIALGICMIAIGISAWTALGKFGGGAEVIENSSGDASVVTETSSDMSVENNQSDVAAESSKEDVSSSNEDASESSQTNDTAPTAAPIAKYFVYPVSGEIIKGFNDNELQYSLTYNDMRLHIGIDIKADAGTAVKSAGDGVVLSAELDPDFGYTVKIDHGNGITGVYSGLTEAMAVKKGDTVTAGANLGPLGTVNNECVDAPHLHLEFYENDKPIDPTKLLNQE